MNTTYYKNLLAANIYGKRTEVAIPATYYIGLSTVAPGDDGADFAEPTVGAYGRVAITNDTTSFAEPVDGVVLNAAEFSFVESTASWGVVTHFGVFDAVTGGNLLMYNSLDEAKTIDNETTFVMKAGRISFSVTD